jgi:Glycosyl hydrolase family 12
VFRAESKRFDDFVGLSRIMARRKVRGDHIDSSTQQSQTSKRFDSKFNTHGTKGPRNDAHAPPAQPARPGRPVRRLSLAPRGGRRSRRRLHHLRAVPCRASGVKAYPNASLPVGKSLNSLSKAASSFNVTVPGSGNFEAAYDIWLNSSSYEVMVWVDKAGNVGPLGSSIGDLTLDGDTWTVYAGDNGSDPVYSFVRTSNESSGSVDILDLLKWMENTKGYFSNPALSTIQFGFEISGTGDVQEDFTANSYSASAS